MSAEVTPAFFVPHADLDKQEEVYVELARIAGSKVPLVDERIYSITYQHDLETWTATVGQQLHGTAWRKRTVRGERVEYEERLSDRSTVMAIFAGMPYVVWHDRASRVWENPFFAGRPTSVRLFAALPLLKAD